MNKFGAQTLGRSFPSLLFAGDDDRRLGRATTIDLEAVLAARAGRGPSFRRLPLPDVAAARSASRAEPRVAA